MGQKYMTIYIYYIYPNQQFEQVAAGIQKMMLM